MEKVSIIIPVYNAEKWLRRCVDSVLSQTYLNIEVILIDDGSTDKSGIICDNYSSKDNRVKAIHKENAGVSEARNDGIAAATGEFIVFIDADDWMEIDVVETLMQHMEYPLVMVGYEEFGIRNRKRGPCESMEVDVVRDIPEIWKDTTRSYWWFIWGKLFHRDIIEKYHLRFKEDMIYLEDYCFVMEYLTNIDRLYMAASYKIHHLIEAEKYSKYRMNFQEFKKHMEIHSQCFMNLEYKCQCTFVPMRERISYRHLYNFTQYIYHSRTPVINKLQDILSFRNSLKEDTFKFIKISSLGIKKMLLWKLLMIVSWILSPLFEKEISKI